MSWITTILKALAAIPAILEAFRELIWRWEAERGLRREKENQIDNDKIHDEIENGGRPRWDDRT